MAREVAQGYENLSSDSLHQCKKLNVYVCACNICEMGDQVELVTTSLVKKKMTNIRSVRKPI